MKTKLPYIAIAGLLGVITWLSIEYYIHESEIETLEKTVFDMQESAKAEKKQILDSVQGNITQIVKDSYSNLSSILSKSPPVEYVPYKELIYVDRTVDSALNIIESYEYGKNK